MLKTLGLDESKKIISDAIKSAIESGVKPMWMSELKPHIERYSKDTER
jgi:hypothetical protein